MPSQSSVQLVLHYDGAGFAGWQRQPGERTVQGVLEDAVARICDTPVRVTGAGRTDAGVHARGQSAGVQPPEKWSAANLRRALNAILPNDVWISQAFDMQPDFHPRFSAISRSYTYHIGTGEESRSPFRNRYEWRLERAVDIALLEAMAAQLCGTQKFTGFAVQGTAPPSDDHACSVHRASWAQVGSSLVFGIEANRFLHHMVRFLVGTMIEAASGKRTLDSFAALLTAEDNHQVSPPAPAHGLFLESVSYPKELYRGAEAVP